MKPQQYRKKPVVIEAVQFIAGPGDIERRNFLQEWIGDAFVTDGEYDHPGIKTLEGTMRLNHGDYIIKGVKGEFYPCKPDIFNATYELATTPALTQEHVLNLIEQSKEKSLPLTWLAGEIKKL